MSSPRVWFITGCSSGLGLDITRCVLKKGDIAVATLRKPSALADLRAQYPADRLLILKLDVTVRADITAAFEKTKEAFGRIDVVVSNAGYAVLGEIEGTPDDVAQAMFAVNFWGAAHVLQEAVRFMREVNPPGHGGRIIQITSGTGLVGFPACGFYSASKHAMEGLTESLAMELDPEWNIKVTAVPLGSFATNAVSTSMVKLPPHPAYTKPTLPSVINRKAILGSVAGQGDPSYEVNGDTSKAAEALYRLSELPSPPMRLMLGKESVAIARAKTASVLAETEQYASWSEGLYRD
ncbi:NAD-P-binding protein [Trametes polyzona]|nr:NAD-P-binding protein [Trametes polyzona]